ncbi:MAG: endonuclease domain-containing protein [Myxococcales bacterium]|nr:endonuclease domain-containing protein [Myxococcales bacterium]
MARAPRLLARRGAGLALTRTLRAALREEERGAAFARVTDRALWVAAPGTPPGQEVAVVARAVVLGQHASRMRSSPTHSESLLWSRLRGSQLGVGFRRQHVIGEYIVDFAAPKLRVVVEVDGGYHERRKAADAKRDARISRLGWRVVRVSDELVERDVEAAVEVVRAALEVG